MAAQMLGHRQTACIRTASAIHHRSCMRLVPVHGLRSTEARARGGVVRSVPLTDASVPEGHKALHTSLYGQGGAEAHDGETKYRLRQEEDEGNTLVPTQAWLEDRDGEKPLGVFAIYNGGQEIQYIGYSRNMVTAIRALVARAGEGRAAYVRAMVFANQAMATRDTLEREVTSWVARHSGGSLPPGNSTERELWEGAGEGGKVLSEAEAAEHAAKATKMRLAMGENRADLAEDSRAPEELRSNLKKAMTGDWSEVVDKQTRDAVGAPASPQSPPIPAKTATAAPPMVSPFAKAEVHRTIGGASDGGRPASKREMTVESVDSVLEEVRPYLMADGGDVEVVEVTGGRVFLRLQGSCSTCASSASTMKMGIERALQAAFGEDLVEVVQVDKKDVVTATADNIDMHLNMLRGAIHSFGGKVEVVEVALPKATIRYKGPPAIGKGVTAAIKDRFPEIKEVLVLAFE